MSSDAPTTFAQLIIDQPTPETLDLFTKIGEGALLNGDPKKRNKSYIIAAPTKKQDKATLKKSLNRAKREVQRATTFEEAYWTLLLEQIRTMTRARNVSMHLVNEDNRRLEPKVWFGDWPDGDKPRCFRPGHGVAGTVWQTGKIYLSGDVTKDQVFDSSKHERSKNVRSILSVPIFNFDGIVIGVLNLDSNIENRFNPHLEWRIEKLQCEAYEMLGGLALTNGMADREIISGFFWAFQKAIDMNYVIKPAAAPEEADAPPPAEPVDPAYVQKVFEEIREELSPGVGKPGPSPVRLDRLRAIFQGRENEAIPLDEFEQAFADSTDARKSAASAVSWLNNIFVRWGFGMEIETIRCTKYRLKRRPIPQRLR